MTGSSGPGFVDVIYEDGAYEANKPRARVRALTSAEKHKPRASLFGTLSYSTGRKGWVANYLDEGLEVPGIFDTPQAAELALLDYHQRGAKRRRDVVVLPTERMNSITSSPSVAAAGSAGAANSSASATSSTSGRRHGLLTKKERFGEPTTDEKSYLANAVTRRSHTVGFYEAVAGANPEWRRTIPVPTQRCPICLEEYGEAEAVPLSSTCSDGSSGNSNSTSSGSSSSSSSSSDGSSSSKSSSNGSSSSSSSSSSSNTGSSSSRAKGSKRRTDGSAVASAGGAVLVGSSAYAVRMKCCMNWFHVACTTAHAAAVNAHQDQGSSAPAASLQCPMCRDEKTYARQLRQVRRDLSHLAPQLVDERESLKANDQENTAGF